MDSAGQLLVRLTTHPSRMVRTIFYGIGIAILLGAAAWALIQVGDLIERLSPHVGDAISLVSKAQVPDNIAQLATALLLLVLAVLAVLIWRRVEEVRRHGTLVGKSATVEIAKLNAEVSRMRMQVDHLIQHHNDDTFPLPKFLADLADDIASRTHKGRKPDRQ